MTSQELRHEIDIKKPRYLASNFPLMEALSIKGTTKGDDYIRFGPFWQTYMYVFMIGDHKGENETQLLMPERRKTLHLLVAGSL